MTQRVVDASELGDIYPEVGIIETICSGEFSPSQDWIADISSDFAKALDDDIRDKYYSRRVNRTGYRMETADEMTRLCRRLVAMHGTEWNRLWKDYTITYNPIWNVDGTETIKEVRDLKQGHSGSEATTASGTDKIAHKGTGSTTQSGTDKVAHKGTGSTTQSGTDKTGRDGEDVRATDINAYGFDSSSGVPTQHQKETLTAGITESTTYGHKDTEERDFSDDTTYGRTDTEERDFSDDTTYGRTDTHERNLEDSDTGSITTTHTRGGNIGVTMTQQMLRADVDFWTDARVRVFDIIINDIVREITYPIYA